MLKQMVKRTFLITYLLFINLIWSYSKEIEGKWFYFTDNGKTIKIEVNKNTIKIFLLDSIQNVDRIVDLGGTIELHKIEIVKNGYTYLGFHKGHDRYIILKLKESNDNNLDAYMFYGNAFNEIHISKLDSIINSDSICALRTGKLYSNKSFNNILKLKSYRDITKKDLLNYIFTVHCKTMNFYETVIANYDLKEIDKIKRWIENDIHFKSNLSVETLIELGYKPPMSGEQDIEFHVDILDKYPSVYEIYRAFNSKP